MKVIHFCAGLQSWNGMANTARQFVNEELARGDDSSLTNIHAQIVAGVDVVMILGAWLPVLWRVAKKAKAVGAKLYIRPAGSYDPVRRAYHGRKKKLVSFFEHRMLRRADVLLATCEAEAKWIREYEPGARKIELTNLKRDREDLRMKITLITACYNSAGTIRTAIESVLSQKGVDVEYIVVDGGSTDGTVDVIKEYAAKIEPATCSAHLKDSAPLRLCVQNKRCTFRWISEPDRGMYDAINKGIKMATGDIVGILNADDVLASDETLAHIASAFESPEVGGRKSEVDCVYADIRFVKRRDVASPSQGGIDGGCSSQHLKRRDAASPSHGGESLSRDALGELRNAPTVRYCSAKRWRPWMFRFAAMVPHPSFYVRRECFERLGGYSLDYRICADFELELRYLYLAKLKAAYLPECVVVMRMGGASTAGWRSNVEINREDLRALRAHGVWSCLPLIYLKYLFKIWGFVFKKS